MRRGIFISTGGVIWVRSPFCWLVGLVSFLVGLVLGFAWVIGFAG
jgi:hypothetical protein